MIDLVLFSRVKCQGRERFSYKTLRCSAPQYLSCLWLDGAKCAHSKIYEKFPKGAAHRNICNKYTERQTNITVRCTLKFYKKTVYFFVNALDIESINYLK